MSSHIPSYPHTHRYISSNSFSLIDIKRYTRDMKIECIKDKLIEGIAKADRLTGKNLSLPILSCINLKASKNSLVLRATNLDCGIEVTIPAKVESEGEVAFHGAVMNSLLAGLPKEKNITLESKDGNILISTSSNKTLIKTFSPDDFPTIPKLDTYKTIEINPKLIEVKT